MKEEELPFEDIHKVSNEATKNFLNLLIEKNESKN